MRLTHAEKLLKSFGINDPKDIDLEAIAFCCGAEVKERSLVGCEAQIIGHKDSAIIIVNENSRPERKRFSIGHELGHWKYHKGQSFICRSDEIGNSERQWSATDPERIADEYAADILMPGYLFGSLANQTSTVSFDVVLGLKEQFSTSILATARRYIQFSERPSMLICHDVNGRKWFRHGKGVPETLFPRAELDAESYAMDVLLSTQKQSNPRVIGADAWFDKWGVDQYEVYEHSIKVHSGQILTLLSWRDTEMLERYAA